MKKILAIVVIFSGLLLTACESGQQTNGAAEPQNNEPSKPAGQAFVQDDESAKNILQIAIGSADHSTLVAGVQAAELENVLANNGPLTVFAPNNAAFDKLPEGTLEDLLKPENKATLARIITYHAAPGTYKDNLLKDGMQLFQATGDNVQIGVAEDGTVTVNGAKILGTVDASNGVVHVIDQVLLPPDMQ